MLDGVELSVCVLQMLKSSMAHTPPHVSLAMPVQAMLQLLIVPMSLLELPQKHSLPYSTPAMVKP
jgi:hypothetical protein